MTPVVALVGRPNVGKSTLFNVLTRTRRALVADVPGLTRDRQYGTALLRGREWIVIDTGGLTEADAPLELQMAHQTGIAIEQADAVFVLVDARDGLTPDDSAVIERLRRSGKPFRLVVNKTDGIDPEIALADFHGLVSQAPLAIAASHHRGIGALTEAVDSLVPASGVDNGAEEPAAADAGRIRVAVVGRPNVGKSTLINRLLNDERMLALDQPGTTRDAVFVDFARDGNDYTLIDTAGLRRRGRVKETVEKFSAIKTLEAIRAAHVVILVLDAQQGIVEQDQHVIGHVLDAGRGFVLAVNKWDGLDRDDRRDVRSEHDRRLNFVDFAETHYISALEGTGVGKLMQAVKRAYRAATRDLSTPELTRVLEDAVAEHAPPMVGGGRIKLRYAHQNGRNPPSILVHGSRTDRLPGNYKRYLENTFRKAFKLLGTPVKLDFRSGANPYAGKKRTSKKTSAGKQSRKKKAGSRR